MLLFPLQVTSTLSYSDSCKVYKKLISLDTMLIRPSMLTFNNNPVHKSDKSRSGATTTSAPKALGDALCPAPRCLSEGELTETGGTKGCCYVLAWKIRLCTGTVTLQSVGSCRLEDAMLKESVCGMLLTMANREDGLGISGILQYQLPLLK